MRRSLRPLLTCLLFCLPVGCTAASGNPPAPVEDAGTEPTTLDEDEDGISDEDEGRAELIDTDGDGDPDYLDTDSDNDGLDDKDEGRSGKGEIGQPDSDNDGVPDYRDEDSDNNGRPDGLDGARDANEDGVLDYADLDDDGDGLTDVTELGADPLEPLNTDGDERPDFRDTDSDGDGIQDRFEREIDADDDGIPAFRDEDSDDDCRPDAVERGDGDPDQSPRNSDEDDGWDFVDLDSDDDGLLDRLEDVNCDGVLDPGESSPLSADTDEDGTTDLIEKAAGTNPDDDLDNPRANGDFVFTVPYQQRPDPAQDTLDFSTNISQADVVFAMDTTGSMGVAIGTLRTALQEMIDQLADEIPSIGIGVTQYKDFPTWPYGDSADEPFFLEHRVMSVLTPEGRQSVQSAVNSLVASGGNDTPESGWEALYQIATGEGTTEAGANVLPFDRDTAPPLSIPAGETVGDIGGVGFRVGSLPILVMITDVPSHNGTIASYNYEEFTSPSYSQALSKVTALGGRVIGMVTNDVVGSEAKADLVAGALATGSVVPPTAWGPAGMRPPQCGVEQCCTGADGRGVAATNNKCPLVFNVSGGGAGLNVAVVQAIKVLTTYVTLDISASAEDDESDAVDAVSAFVDRIIANNGAPEPCTPGLRVVDKNLDGVPDTYTNVFPGPTVCFDVLPRANTSVRPTTEPQVFTANIVVTGDSVTTLSSRKIYFLVPPEIPVPDVD
ncbi:VWA domain-containing protein [Sorangium sp. So ce131]|uniref:VWA domain-containing protein n=1 Tax=Sorangium sp. So ce131 TaxID=3133282 RepID=UPI003F5DC41E